MREVKKGWNRAPAWRKKRGKKLFRGGGPVFFTDRLEAGFQRKGQWGEKKKSGAILDPLKKIYENEEGGHKKWPKRKRGGGRPLFVCRNGVNPIPEEGGGNKQEEGPKNKKTMKKSLRGLKESPGTPLKRKIKRPGERGDQKGTETARGGNLGEGDPAGRLTSLKRKGRAEGNHEIKKGGMGNGGEKQGGGKIGARSPLKREALERKKDPSGPGSKKVGKSTPVRQEDHNGGSKINTEGGWRKGIKKRNRKGGKTVPTVTRALAGSHESVPRWGNHARKKGKAMGG